LKVEQQALNMASLIDKLPILEGSDSPDATTNFNNGRGRVRGPSLGELFKLVGDMRDTADEQADDATLTPEAYSIDLSESVVSHPVPFVLSFSNLTYSVKTKRYKSNHLQDNAAHTPADPDCGGTKTLLNSISGEARDGEILAVLGASGSGKSTLIDALANRIAKGSLKGSRTLNGEPLESRLLKAISAYVMQDDLLFPMLTVEETLSFSAEFRLPRTLSASKKKARVQALIDQLGLRAAANTIIGDEGHRGVSGGERRRVSIGTDIIHDPILLFLDEPTSGLDSTSAFMVVKVLRRIALSGSVVIMSIHQPSYRILGLLDRLLFLSRGQMVYSGTPDMLPHYFAQFGRPISENENRAEFALDLIRELESSPLGSKPLVDFHRTWCLLNPASANRLTTQSPMSLTLKDAISASISRGKLVSGTDGPAAGNSSTMRTYANPFWVEMGVLTKRSFINTSRMPELFIIRLFAVLVTGGILATMFWKLDDSPKGVQERLGFFAFGMSTMYYVCADALPVFINERFIFLRETAYNAYRHSSYVLSNMIVSFPPLVLLSLAFALTTFFSVGLTGGVEGFIFYVLIILASFWSGSGFVTFLSGVVPHVMIGYTVVVAILAYFLLFSGFFINRDRIPDYWLWFHYLSLVKYPYEGVLQNEFGRTGECFVRGSQIFDTSPLGELPHQMKERVLSAVSGALGVKITDQTCVMTGRSVLNEVAVTQMGKWDCLLVAIAWGFLFRFLFYFSLLLGGKNKRR
jgi:ABC-type multidrug transport system ATPase subunit